MSEDESGIPEEVKNFVADKPQPVQKGKAETMARAAGVNKNRSKAAERRHFVEESHRRGAADSWGNIEELLTSKSEDYRADQAEQAAAKKFDEENAEGANTL